MSRIKEALDWRFWIWVPVLSLLVPYVINEVSFLNAQFKIVFVFFILNLAFSVYAGRYLRHHGAFWYLLAVWPLFFVLSVIFKLNSSTYGYYLALVYLIVEAFAFTSGQVDEIDIADQIPVDGGFKEQR